MTKIILLLFLVVQIKSIFNWYLNFKFEVILKGEGEAIALCCTKFIG